MTGVDRSDEEDVEELLVVMKTVVMRAIKRINATMDSRRHQKLWQQKIALEASESVPQALDSSFFLVGLGVCLLSGKKNLHPITSGV
jgi:hypothetical protein